MEQINHLAVLVTALLNMVIGFVWYLPAFLGKAWMEASGMTEEKIKNGNPAKTFGLNFIVAYVMAYNLAFLLADPSIGAKEGLLYGFLAGFGFAFMALVSISLFEQKSWKYIFINGGFIIIYLSAAGLLLGAWK